MTQAMELDLVGLKCPLPVLRIRKAMRGLAPGACLMVIVDDPLAAIDVPHFCDEAGHSLIANETDGHKRVMTIKKS